MVFPGTGGVVLASTNNVGLSRSSDHGQTWRQSMFTNGTITAIVRLPDGALVASVGRGWGCAGVSDSSWGVYRSENEGLTWAKVGTLREQMRSLALHPSGALFAGTDTAVYRSADAGRTWTLAGLAIGNVNGLAGTADGWVYAAIAGKGLFRSSNEGAGWKGTSTTYIGEAMAVMAGMNNEIVLLGSEPGAAIRSTDHGETWSDMNAGLGSVYFRCVTFAQPDIYLSATDAGGCIWDRPLGKWTQLPTDGLPESYINGFAHGASGYVYAWTSSGLFRSAERLTGVPCAGSAVPGQFRLEQNFPNPFNPSTVLRVQLPEAGVVKLEVYDVLGRNVALLVNEKRNAGRHDVRWDAFGLPSGVYICRMTAGNFSASRKMLLTK
jgi:hypothetical protein